MAADLFEAGADFMSDNLFPAKLFVH